MKIISKPAPFNFAGNISDIVVQTSVPVDFKLFVLNGGQLLDERYVPINGEVTIRVRDLLEKVAPTASIDSGFIELPLYIWSVGDLPAEQFRCVRGGHQAATDSEVFSKSNFLTWQPQTRRVNYHTALRLSYVALGACTVMVRGYFKDGTTKEVTIRSLLPNTLHTIDVSYGTVAGLFGGAYPSYYDVWVEGAGIKSYTQRYMYGTPSDNADEFMWINSLGGVDTAIFTGNLKRELKYDSITALFDRTESELEIDAKRVYTKFTGYLPSKNEQLWVLDFFYSTTKYHNDAGALRRIIVSSPKTQSTRGELSGYEFSFAHSTQNPYLNLPRLEVPELLTIEEPDGDVFFLAPRLALFDVAEVGVPDVLIPVQYASSTRWLQLPLADILRLIVSGGSGGGALQKHAMSHAQGGSDPVGPYSIGAAKRAGDRYQNFAAQDLSARNATVEQEVKADKVYAKTKLISPFVSSPEFLAAMIGYGFGLYVDENGESHLHVDYGHFRGAIETVEAQFRKMTFSGEDFLVSSGGIVAEVMPIGKSYLSTTDGRRILTQDGRPIVVPSNGLVVFRVKGEKDVDLQQFHSGDIVWYTWRDTGTGISGASGFLLIKHNFNTFWYEAEVLAGSPEKLRVGMAIGQRGNDKNKNRQGFIHISGRDKFIAIWDGVNSHILSPSMLKVYLGDFRYVTDPRFPEMAGFGLFTQNFFGYGVLVLKSQDPDVDGQSIETYIKAMNGKIELKVDQVDKTAAHAIAEAQKANDTLAEWKSDKLISPTEKNALRQMHRQAVAEKERIDFEAYRWGLTADRAYEDFVASSARAFAAYGKYTEALPENVVVDKDYDAIAAYNSHCVTMWRLIEEKQQDQFLQTGIDIAHKRITLTADTTMIRDNSGREIAMFENGKIKASLIDVDKLVAKQLFARVSYGREIQVGGTIPNSLGGTKDIAGIAGNPRYNLGETERDELQADFFLGFQGVGGGILTISESNRWGEFIKVDKTGYYAFLSSTKRTIISTSQIRIQSKGNTAFFDATVDPDYTGSDLKLFAKKLPIKSQVSGTADISWGVLYVNKNTGQIYSE